MRQLIVKEKIMKEIDSKTLILDVALKHFASNGFEGARVREMATEANVAPATIIYHFKNKYTLFENIVYHCIAQNIAMMKESYNLKDSAYDLLIKYYKVQYSWAIENKYNGAIMLTLYHLASFNPILKSLYTTMLTTARERMREYLYRGKREGLFVINKDIDLIAEVLQEFTLASILNVATTQAEKKSKEKNLKKWKSLVMLQTGYKK